MNLNRRNFLGLAGLGIAAGALSACGKNVDKGSATNAPSASEDPNKKQGNEAQGLMVEGQFVKAAKKGSMTAAFGAFMNHTDNAVTIKSASSPVADMVELHDTVKTDGGMKMQKLDGGIEIPKMEAVKLHPGGKHIMLMGLNRDLNAGDEIAIKVELSDGSSWEGNFPVRVIDNAKEEYGAGADSDQESDKIKHEGHEGHKDDK